MIITRICTSIFVHQLLVTNLPVYICSRSERVPPTNGGLHPQFVVGCGGLQSQYVVDRGLQPLFVVDCGGYYHSLLRTTGSLMFTVTRLSLVDTALKSQHSITQIKIDINQHLRLWACLDSRVWRHWIPADGTNTCQPPPHFVVDGGGLLP